ncbi:CLUMA_CG021521, isoform A [Clunio marinus]|uniref:CLUMA_CG021521, isoform A n=1 Tax=Clunio marinus TaxID=568069 RepID=A0A1J1JBY1_9DIPT|nr:CLUMA_CG021521, isoform A [Clunio marinus]
MKSFHLESKDLSMRNHFNIYVQTKERGTSLYLLIENFIKNFISQSKLNDQKLHNVYGNVSYHANIDLRPQR